MSTPRIIMTRGISASGKSTWAKDQVADGDGRVVRTNRDSLRELAFGDPHYYRKGLSAPIILAARDAIIQAALDKELTVIVDDTNLNLRDEKEMRVLAHRAGADFEVQEFPIEIEVAIERDAARDRTVGADVIRAQANRLTTCLKAVAKRDWDAEFAAVTDTYVANRDLPSAVIVDIDGTVASMEDAAGRMLRSPYDWGRVDVDLPKYDVIDTVRALARDHTIIFLSGRDGSSRDLTATWLGQHLPWISIVEDATANTPADGAVNAELHMRAAGDTRRDDRVKAELFDAGLRNRFNVRLVLDDRDQVVTMWRSIGLTCLQVAPGDF